MRELEKEFRKVIRGEVRFDNTSRALYSTDASNYRQIPLGVILPRDEEDVVRALEVARHYGAPILPRGAGTSLAGQCCNVAVVLDFSRYMNRILKIDPAERTAVVQPGVVLDRLRETAEKYGLTFGPDPATHSRCTLGGMIGNNSCGVHSIYSGKTEENVEELEVLTYRGERMMLGKNQVPPQIRDSLDRLQEQYGNLIRTRFPKIPRRVSGYNLNELLPENGFHVARALVGSEGTCAIVLRAKVRLVESPPSRVLVVLGFRDVFEAADHVPEVMEHKPIALEGFDEIIFSALKRKGLLLENLRLLPEGSGWMLAEFGGRNREEVRDRAQALMGSMEGVCGLRLFEEKREQSMVWRVRESALGATAIVPGQPHTWEGWEDAAVAPEKLGSYLRDLQALYRKYEYSGAFYGHFGDGCVHTRTTFDFLSPEGVQKFRSFLDEASDSVLRYGGSFSGEHGDGQARAELLPKMFGPELITAFREFKRIWDPDNKMNPHKLVDPYSIVDHLRLGPGIPPRKVQTFFQYPEDEGSFFHATLRCVGVAECRKTHSLVMCPSYMVTGEEKHSTRGRARLLFEMMRGEVLQGGWEEEALREALDLCLACKACKRECPVQVDMATYKAEFLFHYYMNHTRPITAYTMGRIDRWARLASYFPTLANRIADKMKILAGVAPGRSVPRFTGKTFRRWFHQRVNHAKTGEPVLLWPDTFSNYLQPEIAIAACEVLEHYGFRVSIPKKPLCCGRPLYDYGMLPQAKSYLEEIFQEVTGDAPILFLEPSCAAVFRDEMLNIFPHHSTAQKLSHQTFLFSEFLRMKDLPLPGLSRKALIHLHCHHRALFDIQDEEYILTRLGLDFRILDSGCCGMAGSFGFEKDHYDLSIRCAERVLVPAIRESDPETLLIANGFSCREQIRQLTGRTPLHLAQVLRMALPV